MRYKTLAIMTFSIGIGFVAHAQQATAPKRVHVNVAAGREVFREYCAVCHGLEAKGNGPASESLRTAPADLTALKERNAGTFPADRVKDSIYSRGSIPAHGTPDMPMWGAVFHNLKSNQGLIRARERNLTAYLESLQPAGK